MTGPHRRWRRRLSERWDRFWFQPVTPELYVVLRVVYGVLGVLAIVEFTPVTMFWAVDGIAPLPGHGFGIRQLVLDSGLSALVAWAYFLLVLSAFVCMTIGYRTSLAILVAFIGTSAMTPWNHLPLSSAVQVLTSVLFCLWWADCSGAPSVDAWLGRRRGAAVAASVVRMQPIWPLRLICIQVCIIYLNTGLWKFLYPVWRDGTAVHYAISHNIFHRFPTSLPPGWDWITTLATYSTLAWEIGFAFMVLHRVTRRVALVAGVLFHAGMAAGLELGPFSLVMIATYLAFLDPAAVTRWMAARRAPAPDAGAAASLPGRRAPQHVDTA